MARMIDLGKLRKLADFWRSKTGDRGYEAAMRSCALDLDDILATMDTQEEEPDKCPREGDFVTVNGRAGIWRVKRLFNGVALLNNRHNCYVREPLSKLVRCGESNFYLKRKRGRTT